jgi:diguanylate cyclase (GGDEF)-like protein
MSFRSRLTLFFVAIVIVPMVAMAVVLFRLLSDNESGKADAALAAHQVAALGLAESATQSAKLLATRIGSTDTALATAIRRQDPAAIQQRLVQLRRLDGLARIAVYAQDGSTLGDSGSPSAVFPAHVPLADANGKPAGALQVSTQTAGHYVSLVRTTTGLSAVVFDGNGVLASHVPDVNPRALPGQRGHIKVGDTRYRVTTFPQAGFGTRGVRVSLLDSTKRTSAAVRHSRELVAIILIGFFILAFTFALLISRSLQRQIAEFLDAAKRIGKGDFSAKVPIHGHDEFAALGEEFNSMAAQLEARLEQIGTQQERLEISMRRIGETFASNLDRDALLDIVVHAAKDGVGATGGRARLRTEDGTLKEVVEAGSLDGMMEAMLLSETEVLRSGVPNGTTSGRASALSHPLRGDDGTGLIGGVVSVAREEPFSPEERDLFNYLVGQAAVSLENVGLHEVVERQAITDDLTGLANRRRFQDAIAGEVERARRFKQGVGLVMLDIDDFKRVNDTYGHQQGDAVLKEIARVLRESSREIDEPARYGGEELVMVLPGADLDGAFLLGERVREAVENLEMPILEDGDAPPLKVTVSLGVAAQSGAHADLRRLIAAADAALYEAKRAGKNKTVRAE